MYFSPGLQRLWASVRLYTRLKSKKGLFLKIAFFLLFTSSNFLNFLIVWKPSEQDQATKKMSYIALLIKKESKQPRTCSQTPSPSFTQGLRLQNYSEDTIEYCESQAQFLCVYGAYSAFYCITMFWILCYPLLPLGWNRLVWCEEWKMFSLDDVRRPSEVFYKHNLYILDTHRK